MICHILKCNICQWRYDYHYLYLPVILHFEYCFLLLLLFFVLYCHHAKLGLDFSSCLCISSDGSRGNIQIDHSTIDAWKPSFQSIFCDNDYRMSSSQIYPPCQNKILYFARLLYFSDCSVLWRCYCNQVNFTAKIYLINGCDNFIFSSQNWR